MKTAVITGGSRGIGAEAAKLFAGRGWQVVFSYLNDIEAAERTIAACAEVGVAAIPVQVDVAKEDDVIGLFEAADATGRLDALVNNAGIVDLHQRVEEYSVERLTRMFNTNVVGAFICAREAVKRMSTAHGGSGGNIVNVGSLASRLGAANEYVDYAASKGAITAMTIGLAKEVAAEGIRVNEVRPGTINTEIHASGGDPDRAMKRAATIPMQRPGEAIEVANAIVWLCSDEATFVSSAVLDVSGGR